MEKAELRRWIETRRAAARLEQAHVADAWGPTAQAIAAALSLIALEGRLRGWLPPADPVTDREDQTTPSSFTLSPGSAGNENRRVAREAR